MYLTKQAVAAAAFVPLPHENNPDQLVFADEFVLYCSCFYRVDTSRNYLPAISSDDLISTVISVLISFTTTPVCRTAVRNRACIVDVYGCGFMDQPRCCQ